MFKDIVQGYKAPDRSSVGEPALGRGGFMLKGLCMLDPENGRGKAGPAWTQGPRSWKWSGSEFLFLPDPDTASTVMDVGKVLNPNPCAP